MFKNFVHGNQIPETTTINMILNVLPLKSHHLILFVKLLTNRVYAMTGLNI